MRQTNLKWVVTPFLIFFLFACEKENPYGPEPHPGNVDAVQTRSSSDEPYVHGFLGTLNNFTSQNAYYLRTYFGVAVQELGVRAELGTINGNTVPYAIYTDSGDKDNARGISDRILEVMHLYIHSMGGIFFMTGEWKSVSGGPGDPEPVWPSGTKYVIPLEFMPDKIDVQIGPYSSITACIFAANKLRGISKNELYYIGYLFNTYGIDARFVPIDPYDIDKTINLFYRTPEFTGYVSAIDNGNFVIGFIPYPGIDNVSYQAVLIVGYVPNERVVVFNPWTGYQQTIPVSVFFDFGPFRSYELLYPIF